MTPDEKRDVAGFLRDLARGRPAAEGYAPDAAWHGSHPFEAVRGLAAIDAVWATLRRAMPDMERRDLIVIGGAALPDPSVEGDRPGRLLLAAMGHLQGTFAADLCGVPATGEVVHLRFAEVHEVEAGRIVESRVLLDVLDLMRQVGCWPLVSSLGAEGMWPGPQDGVRIGETQDGSAAFAIVMAMHEVLGLFDGRSVGSMLQEPYWTKDFMWYGPAGVGTTRGLAGFQAHHQIPFLTGFPDRRGAGHVVRLADGPYVVTGGWPSVVATHTGEWLGVPATGRRVAMRVMDFYRLDGARIAENWVPIDVLYILHQMGFDVLARLAHRRGSPRRDL